MSVATPRAQGGAALVISLIMLALITLLVIAALNLGTANFRAVSNSQFRDEAVAAANAAIQTRVEQGFDTPPTTTSLEIDLNNDTVTDYIAQVTPSCISAAIAESADPSSMSLPPEMSLASTWNTVWDIAASVTDDDTGASVVIHAGARVLLSQPERDAACPDVP